MGPLLPGVARPDPKIEASNLRRGDGRPPPTSQRVPLIIHPTLNPYHPTETFLGKIF